MHIFTIIDAFVSDQQTLITGLSGDVEVLLLNAEDDGAGQIADFLAHRSEIDALHIISHGASGTVQLGDGLLTAETLHASTAIWEQIGQSLSADADILLYGCNVAQGQSGRTFLDRLARITNADVAASTDITGAGGNWVLEANSGDIEAALPTEALAGYAGALATYPGTTGNDSLAGSSANDFFAGGAGNDTLNGLQGIDTLMLTTHSSGYQFGLNASGQITITDVNMTNGNDGADTLISVERAKFSDGVISLRQGGLEPFDVPGGLAGCSVIPLAEGGYIACWGDGSSHTRIQQFNADGIAVGATRFLGTTYDWSLIESHPGGGTTVLRLRV